MQRRSMRRIITWAAAGAAAAILFFNHVKWPDAFHGRAPADTIIQFGELKISTGDPILDVTAFAIAVAGWVAGRFADALARSARSR